jgi:hypothetical protein
MIRDLDDTLKAILDDPASPTELRNADVSFEAPDKGFAPAQATVNLFLYEVKENRELRDPVPITEKVGDIFVRRRPPVRADCTYIATTWSSQVGAAKVAEEHRLLSQALLWLSRFPIIPVGFLQGSLINPPFPHPTMVAQMDGNKNAGEFWSALGIPPRPAFYLTVTIAMNLGIQVPEGPPVVTKEIHLKRKMPPGVTEPMLETFFGIGGTVRNANTLAAITNAQVTILELERATVTDQEGRFHFSDLEEGNYTLRAAATGFATADKAILVPGTVLNAYDVSLTL